MSERGFVGSERSHRWRVKRKLFRVIGESAFGVSLGLGSFRSSGTTPETEAPLF
jgi:hypothetical protein